MFNSVRVYLSKQIVIERLGTGPYEHHANIRLTTSLLRSAKVQLRRRRHGRFDDSRIDSRNDLARFVPGIVQHCIGLVTVLSPNMILTK